MKHAQETYWRFDGGKLYVNKEKIQAIKDRRKRNRVFRRTSKLTLAHWLKSRGHKL